MLGLRKFLVYEHLQRISSKIRYVIDLDINHGTSEAAAVFICGNWLNGIDFEVSETYSLCSTRPPIRISKLVEEDGSFIVNLSSYTQFF